MTDEEIMKMPIGAIASADSYVLLWVTNNHQFLGFKCLEKWGFTPRSTFTWEKVTKDGRPHAGIGHYGRSCTEHFLVGTKGNPGTMTALGLTNIVNVIPAPRLKHSQKPEEFWTIADRLAEKLENCERLGKLSQPSRIELFARQRRPNWDCWGAEAEAEAEANPVGAPL
jgi:N6-adenosine-specific RNA methylase IME4